MIQDAQSIKNVIRHRYPFLLVDGILELEEGKRAVGVKAVTANEEYFTGHFPRSPVMPGVLL
jgi:3-hydroxyacyl-[acyl-carrier-protein] dehydratase